MNILVETFPTSKGTYNRFYKQEDDKYFLLGYLPYEKLSGSKFRVKPDETKIVTEVKAAPKNLQPYNPDSSYVNIFKTGENVGLF